MGCSIASSAVTDLAFKRCTHVVLLAALAVSCHRSRTTTYDVEALLHSRDTVAIYDAGVDAYRAAQFDDARRLWSRTADLGGHEAESNLGFLLYYGYGGAADTGAALQYWQRAMAHLNAEAHHHVAQAIIDGNARLGSDIEAYSHLVAARLLAARPGALEGKAILRDANALRDRLLEYLPRSRVEIAERTGREWSKQYP